MTIKQLSIFLENKMGSINDVTRVLATAGVNMSAFSIADNADFGILRVIVSDVELALKALRENQFAVSQTDVICIECSNTPGALSGVLDLLAAEQVFIEYMYAFSRTDTACVVIRPNNLKRCIEVLNRENLGLITQSLLSDCTVK